MDLHNVMGHLLRTGRTPPRLVGRLAPTSAADPAPMEGETVDDRPLFILSTQGEATDNNILMQIWDTSRGAADGPGIPVMWGHDADEMVGLGQWQDLKMAELPGVGPALTGRAFFDPEDPQAQLIKGKVKRGLIRAVSVGWRPGACIRRSELPKTDPLYREPIDGECGPEEGYIMGTKEQPNTLLEGSLCSVPADPRAVVTERLYRSAERELDAFSRGEGIKIDALLAFISADPRARAWLEHQVRTAVRAEMAGHSVPESARSLSTMFPARSR